MNITELSKDESSYKAQVIIPHSKLEEEISKKLAEIAKTAKMDGFRVGKVPNHILNKKYAASVRADVVKQQLDKVIRKIISDNKLNVAVAPEINDLKNEPGKDLEFNLDFELMPEIKMPDFKNILIEKPSLNVDGKDIDERLKKIAEYSKNYDKESKDGAKKGDQVTIDAVGYVDSVAFEGGKLEAHKLVLGSGAFIPGFEDQLIGKKSGEEFIVNVNFPEEYHAKNLAGKASEFKGKVLKVHTPSENKIDDEFAKKLKCDNLEDLKNKIEADVISSYEGSINLFMKMALFDQLEKLIDFQPPKSLLEQEFKALNDQKSQLLEDENIKSMSEKDQEAYFHKIAFRRVAVGLLLAEYIKKHSLSVTEEDIRQEIFNQARRYPGQEKEVFDFYQKNPKAVEGVTGPILEEKAVKKIFDEEVEINPKSYSKSDLEKLLESQSKIL
ncbi:MAG TPA: trigger factor [Candidatus Megaira endosymbiont of Nemacystus decipiens]|nr:trigger factor [Candidatus Megaera endosymbiont of Nemacystus decipiens]